MQYETLTKSELIELLKEKNAFNDFKAEIKATTLQKELSDIFIRLNSKVATNVINAVEFAQLKQMISEKHAELKTAEQKRAEELARMSFLEQFVAKTEPKEDEEFRDQTLYCKKCNTPRSFYMVEYGKAVKIKCECQQKEYDRLEEQKRIREVKERNLQRLAELGINSMKYSFDLFKTPYEWQRKMLEKVKEFLQEPKKSIIITGQSGAGKTHILSCAVIELIRRGKNVEYLKWLEQGKYLKSIVMDKDLYQPIINRYKNAQVLYIDDFLKVGKNGAPSDADISLAMEILDHRKENNLPTMISSERSLEEIMQIDEATGGRILELCQLRFELQDFKDVKNYRLTM